MSNSHELQVQQKREVEKKTETTTPGRVFRASDRHFRDFRGTDSRA
jgi:hypothetical protein